MTLSQVAGKWHGVRSKSHLIVLTNQWRSSFLDLPNFISVKKTVLKLRKKDYPTAFFDCIKSDMIAQMKAYIHVMNNNLPQIAKRYSLAKKVLAKSVVWRTISNEDECAT